MSTPHDALFKHVFSQPQNVTGELQALLPAAVSVRLDWSTLTALPASFVDERLAGRHADLLFSVGAAGRETLLYVLLEHQSSADALMPFRLLRYVVRIWESFLGAHPEARSLPPVLPVVIHHGDGRWSAATELGDLLDIDPAVRAALGPYVPRFRYFLDDLAETDDDTLRARPLTAGATMALLLLRNARRSAELLADLRTWSDLLEEVAAAPAGLSAFAALLEYIFKVGEVPAHELHRLVSEIGPATAEAFVTTYQQSKAEGKAEGRVEGKAEGRVEGKAEGRVEGKTELLLRMLTVRFGVLPPRLVDRVRAGSPAAVDDWAERLMNASSIDDVLID